MREELLRLFDDAVESARLGGITEAKKAAGNYTPEDSRFFRHCHESIAEDRNKLRALAAQCGGPVGSELDAAAIGRFAQDTWMDSHEGYPAWGLLADAEQAAWIAVGERIKRAIAAAPLSQPVAWMPPAAVPVEDPSMGAGLVRSGDWVIGLGAGCVRVVDARMAHGWNQCREAMQERMAQTAPPSQPVAPNFAAIAKTAAEQECHLVQMGHGVDFCRGWAACTNYIAARAAETAGAPQPVALPDGWVAVPREPTEAMWTATSYCSTYVAFDRFCWDYAAMLKAAPEVPRG